MSTLQIVSWSTGNALVFIRQIMGYIRTFLWAFLSPRAPVSLNCCASSLCWTTDSRDYRDSPSRSFARMQQYGTGWLFNVFLHGADIVTRLQQVRRV